MPYAYYARLNARQKAIYRQSDAAAELQLPEAGALAPHVAALAASLAAARRAQVEASAQSLVTALLRQLGVPGARVRVLATRPSTRASELHGLYELGDESSPAVIKVWMRTAQQRRVVAFRTFLRTLLHELCHHLDYMLLRLKDSFHTEGFFKRESSLFKQLVQRSAASGADGDTALRNLG